MEDVDGEDGVEGSGREGEVECGREEDVLQSLLAALGQHAGGDVHADQRDAPRLKRPSEAAGAHADLQHEAVVGELLLEDIENRVHLVRGEPSGLVIAVGDAVEAHLG